MKHLFIDTNIYLKFYHFSKDDLEQLKKLNHLIENNELQLYLPSQVIDEFNRNRDTKLADALNRISSLKIDSDFPLFCQNYEEYRELRETINKFNNTKQKLLVKVKSDIETDLLKADEVIKNLFDISKRIERTSELVEKAKLRFDFGNPPGKNKSYGDAIIWETLLNEVENDDLYFITDDKDYFSEVIKENFNSFLLNEWKEKKEGKEIKFYKTLTDFFASNFSDIKLEIEYDKEQAIRELEKASSFYAARGALNRIHNYDSFLPKQVIKIIKISLNNTQVYWIGQDEDINTMLYDIIEKNKNIIDVNLLKEFKEKIPKKIIK